MEKPSKYRKLQEMDAALGEGRTEDARGAFLDLSDEERALLREYLGEEELNELDKTAVRRRRGPSLGRVVLLPGLMGTNLESVDASGDADRVWINFFRMAFGRMSDLRLGEDGQPLPPPPHIRTGGIHSGTYLKLLFELQSQWDAIPFGYDWRVDLKLSAAALAERIRKWAKGEPVHLVAHSMGGVLARTFIKTFPDVWAGMQDGTGKGRGGRLVMMGTPNRGAFAIVLALSGEEKLVKTLAKIDARHNARQLLEILNTFPGSYQLLPSPRMDLGDDHRRLFDAATWGSLPVRPGLLKQGKQFQEWLHPVIDPDRLVYVAGYDQPTPVRVRIDGPGRFTYEVTEEGDGRVPHSLGLLENVRTYWVNESHGNLPRNRPVVQAMHLLLQTGEAIQLESKRPRGRAEGGGVYRKPATFESVPAEVEDALTHLRRRGRREFRLSDQQEVARLNARAFADYLGHPAPSAEERPPTTRRRLELQVLWSDITQVKADVYAAGAYSRVPPGGPLRELDKALSRGLREGRAAIGEQISRGWVKAQLGDVDFFPWTKGRTVAVGGMGYVGSFREGELCRLARNVFWAVNSLPQARSLATVLIGSGEGNLTVPTAARAMLQGLADAVATGDTSAGVRRVSLVEYRLDRALEILAALKKHLKELPAIRDYVDVHLEDEVVPGKGGIVAPEQHAAVLFAAAARASSAPGSRESRALDTILRCVPRLKGLPTIVRRSFRRDDLDKALYDLDKAQKESQAAILRFETGHRPGGPSACARVSFVTVANQIHSAVITETTTVTERVLKLDPSLVSETVERMTEPDSSDVLKLGKLLRRLLIHEDFTDTLSGRIPLVFEVDRSMAPVHWEMMADDQGSPLALDVSVARQLRTTFSSAPMIEQPPGSLRALVVGDPGDPECGDDLPGARREAAAVAALLRRKGLDVVELIGAPGAGGRGPLPNIPPATRLDVLSALLEGGFDLMHYAGHGDFDPQAPDRVGWVFKGGLLTPGELERMARAPRLVVANACLSARTSFKTVSGEPPVGRYESGLAPSLADELFRRGVQDFIGTAWPIDDAGAALFATTFYEALLADPPATIGEALLKARRALERTRSFGSLWAAYQHYGDPRRTVRGPNGSTIRSAPRVPAKPEPARSPKPEAGIRNRRRRR